MVRHEFRPIPFKSMQEIKGASLFLETVIENCISSGKVRIQDSVDMKIEEFTLDELKHFEQDGGIQFSCISSINYEGDNVYSDDHFVVLEDYIAVCSDASVKYFLNDSMVVTNDYCEDANLDNYFEDFGCVCDVYFLKICHNNNVFDFKLAYASFLASHGAYENSAKLLMLINDKPVCELDLDKIHRNSAFFEVVQICKTKSGFDIILSFPSVLYFGLRISKDLKLVGVYNLTNYVKDISDEYTHIFAKSKLLEG